MNTFDNSQDAKKKTGQKKPSSTNSYDTQAPPNLLSFMLTNWKPPSPKKPPPIKNLPYFRKRREALSKIFPGEILVVPTGHQKVRSNDTYFPFRPGTDFFYLTGNWEPDCVLVLLPQAAGGHQDILFVEPNPGRSTPTFYTDRNKGELWVGPRLGVEASREKYGVDECRSLVDLEKFLTGAEFVSPRGVRILRSFSDWLETRVPAFAGRQQEQDVAFAVALSEMRLIKDDQEIKELAKVVAATKLGFEDVIARLKTAKSEREVEGVFYTRARMEGNDVGYGTIAAAGPHACTLHWTRNDGVLKKTDLLLLDAGVEGHSLYTADITRTLPIGGKFSREQRQIYELVLTAQAAAFKAVKPGNDFMAPNRAAMKVLAQGLEDLGILHTTAEEALKDENQFYKRYSLHNVSHMLGLDVHDCAQARQEVYKFGNLQVGMVLTVEPGLYFQVDDLTVPAAYRGIGVRIEDDIVVTARGYKNLSSGIPSQVDDVERWIKTIWKKK